MEYVVLCEKDGYVCSHNSSVNIGRTDQCLRASSAILHVMICTINKIIVVSYLFPEGGDTYMNKTPVICHKAEDIQAPVHLIGFRNTCC